MELTKQTQLTRPMEYHEKYMYTYIIIWNESVWHKEYRNLLNFHSLKIQFLKISNS